MRLCAGLYGHVVPTTVANFVKLVRDGAYKGTVFSKVQCCLRLLLQDSLEMPAYLVMCVHQLHLLSQWIFIRFHDLQLCLMSS